MIGEKQPITTTLVGMNVAVFAVMVLMGVPPVEPTSVQLLKWGANWGPLSLGAEPWRMLASNYIHVGIIHIALNMWCLWNLGFLAERVFDPWTYVLVYTACGLAGSLSSLWWHPLVVGAGASGAIFGLAGALIAALYLGHLPISRQAIQGTLKSLLSFAGYNLFFGAVARNRQLSSHWRIVSWTGAGRSVGKTSCRSAGNPRWVASRRVCGGRSRAFSNIHAGEAREWERGAAVRSEKCRQVSRQRTSRRRSVAANSVTMRMSVLKTQ